MVSSLAMCDQDNDPQNVPSKPDAVTAPGKKFNRSIHVGSSAPRKKPNNKEIEEGKIKTPWDVKK
jgi:hypothetical protein